MFWPSRVHFLPTLFTDSVVASVCFPLQASPCFSSGDYPGFVLQDPQQPLLSWNDQQHLHGRVQHCPHIVALFLHLLPFLKNDNFTTCLREPYVQRQKNPLLKSFRNKEYPSQKGVINGCVEVFNPHPELWRSDLANVLVFAGRGQQQALVSQLWQQRFLCVFWSQTSIKITLTPSTIPPVLWRKKVSFSLF